MSIQGENSDYFRQKVWYIINTLQANQLFVHSSTIDVIVSTEAPMVEEEEKKTKGRKKEPKKVAHTPKKLPEILTLSVLNALVPNSAMLLIGGHGGGKTSIVKYLGRMFTGISLSEAEECIIRGHPQLTEEKIIGTLNIAKLMKDGKEEIVWRTFASSFWKIIDEVNRCSPYTQNILLSLLAEGKIKYYDSVLNVQKYCLYATLNPNDVGTFEMSAPFLDRFGISVPISMPKSQDLAVILDSRDEKLGGYDELVQVPQVLTEKELLNIWFEVSKVPCSPDAADFINALIREYTLCDRVDKGNSDYLKPSSGLCSGCHFFIPEKLPCCNSDSILSVRVAKDLLRYARALTWLVGETEVSIKNIIAIAPYIIAHRVKYVDRMLNKAPYWGNKYVFTKDILELVRNRFTTRQKAYELIKKLREGLPDFAAKTSEIFETLKPMAVNDLIVRYDLYPLAETLANESYQALVLEINTLQQARNIERLCDVRQKLLHDMDFPNRGEVISHVNRILRELTLISYNCSMQLWESIRFTVDAMLPQFTKKLRETTQQRGTYRLRTEDLELEINVTGIQPLDIVNFSFFGGKSATKLKEEIEGRHGKAFKSMDELLNESKLAEQEAAKSLGLPPSAPKPVMGQTAPIKTGNDEEFDEDFYKN